jgi:hypothetical protein
VIDAHGSFLKSPGAKKDSFILIRIPASYFQSSVAAKDPFAREILPGDVYAFSQSHTLENDIINDL